MVADHHLKLEQTEQTDEVDIKDSFLDQRIFAVASRPWYADILNYLACNVLPLEFTNHQKNKLFSELKYNHWDGPILYMKVVDQIIGRCVPNEEVSQILEVVIILFMLGILGLLR